MNEWSQVVLVVALGAVFSLALAIVSYALLVSNKRMAEGHRDLLKAVLAGSENTKVVALAGSMEGTDRAEAVAHAQSMPSAMGAQSGYPPRRVPREVGS